MGSIVSSPGPNAVHLCVDVQNLFAPGGPWATPWMEKALPSIIRLAAHAPERTVFTRFIPPANASEGRGVWRDYYHKWENVTRDRLQPDFLNLRPDLERFVPPASVIDRIADSDGLRTRFRAIADSIPMIADSVPTVADSGG